MCVHSHTKHAHCENRQVSKAQSFPTLHKVVHLGANGQTVIYVGTNATLCRDMERQKQNAVDVRTPEHIRQPEEEEGEICSSERWGLGKQVLLKRTSSH